MCFILTCCCSGPQNVETDAEYFWRQPSRRVTFERREVESLEALYSQAHIFNMSDFRIEKQLGMGSNSNVYLLVRVTDKKKFAGKMLNNSLLSSLINESAVMSNLSGCSTIASLNGVIVNPKCLVLSYHKNGDLATALTRDKEKMRNGSVTEFPFLRRLEYIRDACKAVDFMHKSNICHRDLAMRNFLLSDDMEHVLLSDFSLSRFVKGIDPQVTFCGQVPIVAPPETFSWGDSGGWHYSLKSDIWELGITMFEIVTKTRFKISQNSHHLLPKGLPESSLPSKNIFNRGWDLWYRIRGCWNLKCENRPWSWEVLPKITDLIENPLVRDTNINRYYKRYSPSFCNSTVWNPTMKFTWSEFQSQKTLEMNFSEDTWIGQHRSREDRNSLNNIIDVQANPLTNPSRNSGAGPPNFSIVEHEITRQSTESTYCPALEVVDYYSDVTNIAECKDRHFFDDNAREMIKQSLVSGHEDFCDNKQSDSSPVTTDIALPRKAGWTSIKLSDLGG